MHAILTRTWSEWHANKGQFHLEWALLNNLHQSSDLHLQKPDSIYLHTYVPGADDNRGMIHDNALIPDENGENHETEVLPFLVWQLNKCFGVRWKKIFQLN